MYAAAPEWFADNVLPIAGGTLAVLTFAIVRLIQKTALRITLLMIVAAFAVFVYTNRNPLEECARTCKCTIARQEVHLPVCESDLDL